jgi:hypothetical protein
LGHHVLGQLVFAISRPAGRFGHRYQEFGASCFAAGFPHEMREFAAFSRRGRFWPSLFRLFGFLAISRSAGRFGHRCREFGASCFAAGFPHEMREFAAFSRCGRFWPSLFRLFGFLAISRPAGRFGHRCREFRARGRAAGFPRRLREFAAFLLCDRLWPALFRRFRVLGS